ncbi:1-acyl-sn-glycerol-3-phosphate acyltransferase [Acuticoccus sp. M5D2P5]|uniref:lysophospholipid acyltransferase family protein n=1 Tax=Acuticoccus kalidii TaxID=2910977 RepID=UPI001F170D0D|nr:lysophospholipid acyltransferase family protein [Acuticoccus kalidii]MCF3932782.1 1-acyl-sn-glycerol-3-phosphate acyltransferase [Acuticoccus kalidii]
MSISKSATAPAAPSRREDKGPRKDGLAHAVALVRTAIYSVLATAYFICVGILSAWIFVLPAEKMRAALKIWVLGDMWLLRVIVGQKVEILGKEHIPTGPALVAAKHQSAWETQALLPVLPKGVIILKQELLKIPLYGWYARYFGMIPVNRASGPQALKQLAIDAKAALDRGAQIAIFPEGTRRLPGAPPDYKIGAVFLYEKLKVEMVPVALNSGLFWPRRRFVKYPGTITMSFLPPIEPGLKREDARARLEAAIETETARLVARAQAPSSARNRSART